MKGLKMDVDYEDLYHQLIRENEKLRIRLVQSHCLGVPPLSDLAQNAWAWAYAHKEDILFLAVIAWALFDCLHIVRKGIHV